MILHISVSNKDIKWYLKKLLFYLNLDICYFPAVMVQEDYHSQNPYHNAVHAADVTQAMHCYLQEPKVREHSRFYITCKYSNIFISACV